MKKYKGLYSFLLLVAVLLLMSACTSPVIGSGGSSLTVAQVLQNSSNAMKQLKSVHFSLEVASNVQTIIPATSTGTSATPAVAATPTATSATPSATAATPTAVAATATVVPATPTAAPTTLGQVSISITGSGDDNLPNQQSLQITVGQSVTGQHTSLSEVLLGNQVYIQSPKGQWYVVDKSVLERLIGNPFSGINVDPTALLSLIQNATLTDNGTESLNGQNLRHISASLSQAALKLVLSSSPQLSKLVGQQNIASGLDRAKAFQASLDFWIDETNFYVHRTELKFTLVEGVSSLVGTPGTTATPTAALPASLTTSFDSVIDLSKFNQLVTITPPANALPTDNPISVLGLGG